MPMAFNERFYYLTAFWDYNWRLQPQREVIVRAWKFIRDRYKLRFKRFSEAYSAVKCDVKIADRKMCFSNNSSAQSGE